MVLKISHIGLISLLILPGVFLLTLKILGFSTDPLGLIFTLLIAEGLSLIASLVIVLQLKGKKKVPIPQT